MADETLRSILAKAAIAVETKKVDTDTTIDLALSEPEDVALVLPKLEKDLRAGGYDESFVRVYGVVNEKDGSVDSVQCVLCLSCYDRLAKMLSPGFRWSASIPLLNVCVVQNRYKASIIESPVIDFALTELTDWANHYALAYAKQLVSRLNRLGEILEDYTPDEIRVLRESWCRLNGINPDFDPDTSFPEIEVYPGAFGWDYRFWLEDYCYHDRVARRLSGMEWDLRQLRNSMK